MVEGREEVRVEAVAEVIGRSFWSGCGVFMVYTCRLDNEVLEANAMVSHIQSMM